MLERNTGCTILVPQTQVNPSAEIASKSHTAQVDHAPVRLQSFPEKRRCLASLFLSIRTQGKGQMILMRPI